MGTDFLMGAGLLGMDAPNSNLGAADTAGVTGAANIASAAGAGKIGAQSPSLRAERVSAKRGNPQLQIKNSPNSNLNAASAENVAGVASANSSVAGAANAENVAGVASAKTQTQTQTQTPPPNQTARTAPAPNPYENALFVANKPRGVLCSRFLATLKKRYGVKKAGFSGTLDPFASGALIIGFGDATRLFRFLQKSPKLYRATLWLGAASETLDYTGIRTDLSGGSGANAGENDGSNFGANGANSNLNNDGANSPNSNLNAVGAKNSGANLNSAGCGIITPPAARNDEINANLNTNNGKNAARAPQSQTTANREPQNQAATRATPHSNGVREVREFSQSELAAAAAALVGDVRFVPPKFSAKRIGGKRAYDLARRGADFALSECEMRVFSAKILHYAHPFVTFEVEVSEGGFVRSWAQLFCEWLGVAGALSALRRLREGRFAFDGERRLNARDFLNVEFNKCRFGAAEFAVGKKLYASDFERTQAGVWAVDLGERLAVVEICADGRARYVLNGLWL